MGALWNGGVFAFRLGYLLDIAARYTGAKDRAFESVRAEYSRFPKISFDYEVAEKAESVAVVPFNGTWKDLGTWDALSEVLGENAIGNVLLDPGSTNTHAVNRLGIPCLCVGTDNLMVAASPDGILVADKSRCEDIKPFVARLDNRPMFEERRWGQYKVLEDYLGSDVSSHSLVKHLILNPGKNISYQEHRHRSEIWTFIEGEGELLIDGQLHKVGRGDVANIRAGQKHAVRAITELHFIEVQLGDPLVEEDIIRYDLSWPEK